nr:type IV pilus modification protein PilV [Hydrogenophaga sp.]
MKSLKLPAQSRRRRGPASPPPYRQRGVGLIEILVAVLILSLGLLGMAGLQSRSLSTNQSSYARTQAVMLSYYMLDAMRADRTSAELGNYNRAAICNPAGVVGTALSDNNLRHWVTSLRTSLGEQGTCGQVNVDAITGNTTVTITWDDSRAGGLGAQTFVTTSRL